MPTIPEVLTIDLDDTLWDVRAVIERAERKLREWLVQRYPRVVEQFDPEAIRDIRQQVVADCPERSHDFPFLRMQVLRRMLAGSGYDPAAAAAAYAVFDGWRNTVTLFDDALPALERLAGRFRLIALTNGSADVARIGLGHVFSDSVTAVRAGAPKPERAIFDYVVGLAGVASERLLHVGDDAHLDVDAARRAGLQSVWINRNAAMWPEELPPPQRQFTNLGELADALEAAGDPRA